MRKISVSIKKIAVMLASVILSAALMYGCGGDNAPETVDAVIAPEYAAVDLNGYNTYYFHAEDGSDSNEGTAQNAPKKTLSAAAELAAQATESRPIRLLFGRGSRFEGNLTLAGYAASEAKPLILDAYGEGEKYPVIAGWGSDTDINAVIKVEGGNTRIYNLEITGPTAYQGIYVQPSKPGVYKNIVIEGCYVHDVNFMWDHPSAPRDTHPSEIDLEQVCTQYRADGSKFGRYVYRRYSAIGFNNDIIQGPAWFEDIWIVNNRVVNIGKIGINVYNMWNNQPGFGYGYNKYLGDDLALNNAEKKLGRFPHKNVTAYGNYIECPGGDGLVLSGVEGGFIDGNVCYYANYLGRPGYWNAGIWVFGSRDIVMQHNEAGYTYPGGGDGEGFDIDNSCVDIVFQYNYAHHNEGGGLLLCNKTTTLTKYNADGTVDKTLTEPGKWENNIIRNNIFAYNGNDLRSTRSAFITIARQVNHVYAYNNTVILRDDIWAQSIIETEDKSAGAACHSHYYYNNIFYSAQPLDARFTITMMYDYIFSNNLYYNVSEEGLNAAADAQAITGINPLFTLPEDFRGLDKLAEFAPEDSRIFTLGKYFKNMDKLRYDILGSEAGDAAYLGAIGKAIGG